MNPPPRTWLEVSLPRLRGNVAAVRRRIPPGTGIVAIVKADAYGHGLEPVVRCLYGEGVREFAVATPEEALPVRRLYPDVEILVLGGCSPGEEKLLIGQRLTASVFDDRPLPAGLKTQIKIDTGMGRLGIPWERFRDWSTRLPGKPAGVFSHFASAESDPELTRLQLVRFLKVTRNLQLPRHIANSAGLKYPEAHLDAVRPGLALYGIASVPELNDLKPIQSWKTRILTVNRVLRGCSVGYQATWVASRDSWIGVLPVGYADGFDRRFSNRGQVRVRDCLVPVVGRVSMDLTLVDLTDLAEVGPGELVTLMENDSESPLSAAALAARIDTIPYELLTLIGNRVERVALG